MKGPKSTLWRGRCIERRGRRTERGIGIERQRWIDDQREGGDRERIGRETGSDTGRGAGRKIKEVYIQADVERGWTERKTRERQREREREREKERERERGEGR